MSLSIGTTPSQPPASPSTRAAFGKVPAQPSGAAALHQPSATMPSKPSSGLSSSDIDLILAMAAVQLNYGKPAEAVALLAAVSRLHPDDERALRLLVVALLKLKRLDEADAVLARLEQIEDEIGTIGLLYRSLLAFKRKGLDQARRLFAAYRTSVARQYPDGARP